MICPGTLFVLVQEAGDPVPFGPATWSWRQYLGIGVYVVLFLAFVLVVQRLARLEDGEISGDPPQP